MKQAKGFCPTHNQVLGVKQTPNHILHLLISLFTFGGWVFVWAIITIAYTMDAYNCPQCGSTIKQQSVN